MSLLDTRHDFRARSAVAPQLICDDHTENVAQSFREFAKELLCLLSCPFEAGPESKSPVQMYHSHSF